LRRSSIDYFIRHGCFVIIHLKTEEVVYKEDWYSGATRLIPLPGVCA